MTKRSNNRPLRALISLVRSDQEPLQHRAMQITAPVAAALFMENLDSTIIVTALPQMARSFGASPVGLNIGVTAYALTLAVVIPIGGWMADRFGARCVFAAAIAIFTGASVLCGFSQGQWSFTACRILQGAGGAMMTPVGRLVSLRATEKRDLVRLISYVALSGLVAPVLGPPVGGAITTYLGWRWIFFLNLPLGLIGIWYALALISDDRVPSVPHFDLSGFLLCGSASVSLIYGLELLGRAPTLWAAMTAFIGAGLLLGTLALVTSAAPNSADRSRCTAHSHLCDDLAGRIIVSRIRHHGAVSAADDVPARVRAESIRLRLANVPLFAGSLGMKIVTTRLLRRYGFRRVLLVNGTLTALTIVGCAALTPSTPYTVIAIVLFASGLTRSLQFSALNSLAFADVPPEQMSAANTLANVVQQLTLGFGVAAAAAALHLAALLHRDVAMDPTLTDFRTAIVAAAIMAAVSTLDALTLSPDAGSLVSGHRPLRSERENDLANSKA
jgi:MFS family permease